MTASIISLRWKHLRLKTRWHLSYRQARHPKDGKQLLWPFARFQKYVNVLIIPPIAFAAPPINVPTPLAIVETTSLTEPPAAPNIFSSTLPILLSISYRSSCLRRLVSRSISSTLILSATITRFSDGIYVSNTLSPPKSFPRRRSDGRLPHPNSTLSSPYHTD